MASEYLNNSAFEAIIIRFQRSKQGKARYEAIMGDIRESCRQRKDSARLEQKTAEHKKISEEFRLSQEQLATAFYTLCENIVRYAKSRFPLIDEQDAVQEGVMICFDKIDRFDPSKGKAFNYMTTCILNHFKQLSRTTVNFNEFKRKYYDILLLQFKNRFPKASN